MMEPMTTSNFKTIDELLESDYKIFVSKLFSVLMKNSSQFQGALKDGRLIIRDQYKSGDLLNLKSSMLCPCELTSFFIQRDFSSHNNLKFYVLPERFMKTYLELDVGFLNPLLGKLQRMMDLSFDVGLTQAWQNFHEAFVRLHLQSKGFSLKSIKNPREILHFSEILPIFAILFIGNGIAFFALLCEIFYKDFWSQHDYFRSKWRRFKVKIFGKSQLC